MMTHQKNLSQAPSQEAFLLLKEQELAAITGGSGLPQQIDDQINQGVHILRQTNPDKENKGVFFNQTRQDAKDSLEALKAVKARNQYIKYKETRGVYYPR